jgi:glycosyltransferase involved in cell wall biosynthesis
VFGVKESSCEVLHFLLQDPPRYNNPERPIDLLAVGRLVPTKGHEYLIRALPSIRTRCGDVRLKIIGEGPLQQDLERLIHELDLGGVCELTGGLPHNEVLNMMSRAKMLITPSINEAFGFVNIEAFSVGTPVIASNVDGMKEIVDDGYSGFLVPPANPAAIAEKVCEVMTKPALRHTLSENARTHFQRAFSMKNITCHAEQIERTIS